MMAAANRGQQASAFPMASAVRIPADRQRAGQQGDGRAGILLLGARRPPGAVNGVRGSAEHSGGGELRSLAKDLCVPVPQTAR